MIWFRVLLGSNHGMLALRLLEEKAEETCSTHDTRKHSKGRSCVQRCSIPGHITVTALPPGCPPSQHIEGEMAEPTGGCRVCLIQLHFKSPTSQQHRLFYGPGRFVCFFILPESFCFRYGTLTSYLEDNYMQCINYCYLLSFFFLFDTIRKIKEKT